MLKRIIKKKDGFTLVELLVVLVILAILAASVIPSMMGFIDKAKSEQYILECRNCVISANVLINERYARGEADVTPDAADVKTLADVPGTVTGAAVGASGTGHTELLHLVYTRDTVTVTFCAHPDTCPDHEKTYTIGDYTGGATPAPPPTAAPTDSPAGSQDSVTLTDSGGNTHSLNVTGDWASVKAAIKDSGYATENGQILSDETGVYIFYGWSQNIAQQDTTNMTLAQLAAEHPTFLTKMDSSTTVLTQADISGGKWTTRPKAKDIIYLNGIYYISVTGNSEWDMPPGSYITIPQ